MAVVLKESLTGNRFRIGLRCNNQPERNNYVVPKLQNLLPRLVGIDGTMNAIFMGLKLAGRHCKATHMAPSIFDHGIFSGEYVSWQRIAPMARAIQQGTTA